MWEATGDLMWIVAPEMVEKYNDDVRDWRASLGTGPFMVTDYVPASSITFVRNPDYWGRDPILPQNQLPYLDGVKYLIIPDLSTRQAALRTGKLDRSGWQSEILIQEDVQTLLKTAPALQYAKSAAPYAYGVGMRIDKPELPFKDIRVRHALAMAVDRPAILREFYGGDGLLLNSPSTAIREVIEPYTPLKSSQRLSRSFLPTIRRRRRSCWPRLATPMASRPR